MIDEGQRNHLCNVYLSRIADLWIPSAPLDEKVSFINFLAQAINSWRPLRPEYFRHEDTTKVAARTAKRLPKPKGNGAERGAER